MLEVWAAVIDQKTIPGDWRNLAGRGPAQIHNNNDDLKSAPYQPRHWTPCTYVRRSAASTLVATTSMILG
jgi:hypothetical protein